jgi:hypothetical protein
MLKNTVSVAALIAVSLCLLVPARAAAETVKARVLDVDTRRSEVSVDVAGQRRTYHVDNRGLFGVLREGRLVVITAELVGGRHTIVNARNATQQGRVEGLDERRGSVTIRDSESNATRNYDLDSGVRRDMGVGDVVSFEVEERGPRNVIVRWTRESSGRGDRFNERDNRGDRGALSDSGRIISVDRRRARIAIDMRSARREQEFEVEDRQMLDAVRAGDPVNFEYRRVSDRWVVVSIRVAGRR